MHRKTIEQYIEGWKTGNIEMILDTLTDNCTIIESHGPVYEGKPKVRTWAESWFAAGNIVNSWQITSFYKGEDVIFFEWVFSCKVEGVEHQIEGISICKIEKGKIAFLREYRTTKPLFKWTH